MKTLLDLLESKGLPKVKKVWDYKLISPSSVDDSPELYLYITDVNKDGEKGESRTYHVVIKDIDLLEVAPWNKGNPEPRDPFIGSDDPERHPTEMERGGAPIGIRKK